MNKNIELSNLFKQVSNNTLFYKNSLPDIDDVVRGKILNIDEAGINFHLIEYGTSAFMSFQEASNSKKLYRIKREFKHNKSYIVKVINVDYDKKYIDVSSRNVYDDERDIFLKNINLYEKLFNALIRTYIFYKESDENLNIFLEDTIYTINIQKINKYVEKYYENNEYFLEKMPNILDYIPKENFIENLVSYLPIPKYQLNILFRINSTGINAKYDIINAIKFFNNEMNYNLKFEKTPYFRSKIDYSIKSSIDKDTEKTRKELENLIKVYLGDKKNLYIITDSIQIEAI